MLTRLVIILLILVSCHSLKRSGAKEKDQVQESPVDYAALNYEKGTVKYFELDGCTYIIELENGKRLQPDKLDTSFSRDNLKIWIKYKQVDRMNICMSGITVNIIDIKLRAAN